MTDSSAPTFASQRDSATSAIRVGDILSRSLSLFTGRWAPFIGLAFVAFLPEFLFEWFVPNPTKGLALLGPIIQMACTSLADAAIIYGVVQELRGRGFIFSNSLRAGFDRLGAVIGLSLAVGLCITLAAILLLIPGLIVWCIYAVAMPVCVVERLGVGDSLKRSSFLTKGNRWRIFGVTAGVLVGTTIAIELIVGLLVTLGSGDRLAELALIPAEAVAGAFNAVMVGVLYYQLRVTREGVDIEQIAAVFD